MEVQLTGGPWGTLAHVEAWRAAIELLAATDRVAAWREATLMVDNMLNNGKGYQIENVLLKGRE